MSWRRMINHYNCNFFCIQHRCVWQEWAWEFHHVSGMWQTLLLLVSAEKLYLLHCHLSLWQWRHCFLRCLHGIMGWVCVCEATPPFWLKRSSQFMQICIPLDAHNLKKLLTYFCPHYHCFDIGWFLLPLGVILGFSGGGLDPWYGMMC